MPISMYRRLIRKVIAQTYAAYCQGQPLAGWWAARRRLDRLCKRSGDAACQTEHVSVDSLSIRPVVTGMLLTGPRFFVASGSPLATVSRRG